VWHNQWNISQYACYARQCSSVLRASYPPQFRLSVWPDITRWYLGLPGRHVEKPDTLDLFLSSVREPKIEGLDLYISAYLSCSSRNFQQDESPQNRTVRFKNGYLATALVLCWIHRHSLLTIGRPISGAFEPIIPTVTPLKWVVVNICWLWNTCVSRSMSLRISLSAVPSLTIHRTRQIKPNLYVIKTEYKNYKL